MWLNRNVRIHIRAAATGAITLAGLFTLLLPWGAAGMPQTDDSKPDELAKQRSALYVQATRTPLAELEAAVNHLAVLSETCRAQYGSKACSLPDKALASDKLDERYAYYVKGPVEAHEKAHGVKVDRKNWGGAEAPAHP